MTGFIIILPRMTEDITDLAQKIKNCMIFDMAASVYLADDKSEIILVAHYCINLSEMGIALCKKFGTKIESVETFTLGDEIK